MSVQTVRRLLLVTALSFPLMCAAAEPAEPAFEAAFHIFDEARQGKSDKIDDAIAAFKSLPVDTQKQPLYTAYLGSCLTLKGKAAWMPWNKLRYPEQGLDQLDSALTMLKPDHDKVLVRDVPVSLQTRLVAAATFVALPDGIFHRRAQGAKLLAALRSDPLLATAPAPFKAEVTSAEARLKEAEK